MGVGILGPFFKNLPGVRGMDYILLAFASEHSVDMDMCVISVNPSKSAFPVKFLFFFPHPHFLCLEALSAEYHVPVPNQKGLRKSELIEWHQNLEEGEGR